MDLGHHQSQIDNLAVHQSAVWVRDQFLVLPCRDTDPQNLWPRSRSPFLYPGLSMASLGVMKVVKSCD